MFMDACNAVGAASIPPPLERERIHSHRQRIHITPQPCDAVLWGSPGGLLLERGGVLPEVRLRYQTYGRLNTRRDNAILIFHALTGSAHVAGRYSKEVWAALSPFEQAFGHQGWWDRLVG